MGHKHTQPPHTMTVTLYYHPFSNNSLRVLLYLQLRKIEHVLVKVDLMSGEHKTEAFVAKNPRSQVPALDHDGVFVVESTAILLYLESVFPDGNLTPATNEGKALVYTRLDQRLAEWKHWDRDLKGKKFLAGDSITIAD